MLNTALRTVTIYLLLILFMRLTGKRQIGELQLSELVVTLLISELATVHICDPDIPLLNVVFPMLLIISLEIIASFLVTKSPLVKRILDGTPSFLIKKGVIDQKELQKQRVSLEEFLGMLRTKSFAGVSNVEYAILEQNGQISTFNKQDNLEHPVIVDGRMDYYNMKLLNLSENDINTMLRNSKCRLSDVFLYTVTDDNNTTLILKERN